MGLSKFLRNLFNAVNGRKRQQQKAKPVRDETVALSGVPEETPTERHLRLQHAVTRIHCPSRDRPLPTAEKYLTLSPYLEIRSKSNAARNQRLVDECGFFWGAINAAQAEQLLAGRRNGTFLLRKSMHTGHLFTLSCVYAGRVGHLRILYNSGHFAFSQHPHSVRTESLLDLIDSAVAVSRHGDSVISYRDHKLHRDFDIYLLEPLRKVSNPLTLRQLCELALAQNDRRDSVASSGRFDHAHGFAHQRA
ncbi:suppressor of cytokine signaling 7-like [Paramacrobiotus metropolitanus]|uniref:suppressor of cytokine signaling 7-like n=1 Tax=Paramacrobiotus metropolitanus TaxID=2943436 RepID=UPI002445B465|nr:suppressor of cytokine signaling 7-like [Paramacrobiotus metropolitanus]